MGNDLWSMDETAKARELISRGANEEEFRRVLRRTRAAAHSRIKYLDEPGHRDRRLERARILRQTQVVNPRLHSGDGLTRPRQIPPEVLADAERRNLAERTTTALLCGDPAPGQSALDRRNAQVSA